jgi:hypothetical protein
VQEWFCGEHLYFSDAAIVWLERKFNELYWKEAIGV